MAYNWSVWLLPKTEDKRTFAEYVTFYSKLYGSDSFSPHVTLFGRINANPKLFYSFFNKIKSESKIENVRTLNIKIGNPPWKRMYIQLLLNKNLLELQNKIDKKLRKYRDYQFDPHLSLAYGNFIPNKKDIRLISFEEMISFSSLAIVDTPNDIKDWSVIQKFDSA
ncbi:MAG: hypothetical protein CMG63_02675 [Candidatus Marinimicrobia bacterium]|nr:hypothetical protein [Candidatus Neomarinimicrobiota bacterium]